jgi:hypothetical protein
MSGLSNYPPGMTHDDLVHVGERAPDECDECGCENGEQWDYDPEMDMPCMHRQTCGCEGCPCDCHEEG